MTSKTGIKIIFGIGTLGDRKDPSTRFHEVHEAQELLNVFRKHGGNEIDGARIYPPDAPESAEALTGQTDVTSWARIDSKVWSLPGDHSRARLNESVAGQLDAYKIASLNIEYLHAPDPKTSLADMMASMDALYRAGKFQRLGLTNYSIAQIQEILALCDQKGYVRPSAYQGHYNVMVRSAEEELIPLLRKHNIEFHAWSPAGGGMFSKKSFRMKGPGFTAQAWRKWYDKPELIDSIDRINERATSMGTTMHAVALRWILHHSALSAAHGDAIVIGASSSEQLESTMQTCAGDPLPQDLVDLVDEIAEQVKDVAPRFSINE